MKELAVALLTWISSHTPLAYDGTHVPQIMRVPQVRLVQILYQGNVPQGLDVNNVKVLGLYNYKDRNIYLLDEVDVTTTEGKAILVHELVHYLQYHQGLDKTVPCMRKLEPPAYGAQAEYLKEHGEQPHFNELHVLMVASCLPIG